MLTFLGAGLHLLECSLCCAACYSRFRLLPKPSTASRAEYDVFVARPIFGLRQFAGVACLGISAHFGVSRAQWRTQRSEVGQEPKDHEALRQGRTGPPKD
eukprot:7831861-Alexandrium_andersonii.AAC.1